MLSSYLTPQTRRTFSIMKTFQSLMVPTVTLLVVFSSFAQCTVFMQNGKPYDDKFYKLFMEKAPVEEIVKLAVNWNAEKQLAHFYELYQHIETNDKWAEYSHDIINAAEAVLQKSLKQVGYKKEMSLEEYLVGTFQIQNGMKDEVPPNVLEGIELLDKVDQDSLEKLLNQGSEEELEWELNNLHPYKTVPISGKPVTFVKGPIESKPEESQDELGQESQEPEETPVSETNKFEDEVDPETQKFEDNPVLEPQNSEDNVVLEPLESEDTPASESENSEDNPVPDSPKSEDESVSEPQESEEFLPEPSESGDYFADEQESNEQESEDQIQKPQEYEEVPQEIEEARNGPINESEDEAIAQPEESEEALQPRQES